MAYQAIKILITDRRRFELLDVMNIILFQVKHNRPLCHLSRNKKFVIVIKFNTFKYTVKFSFSFTPKCKAYLHDRPHEGIDYSASKFFNNYGFKLN